MVWGIMITWYLFLAGLSAGAFISSVYVDNKYPGRDKFVLISRIVALLALAVGLILLIADAEGALHNPLSLFFLLHGTRTSVMSWGVILLIIAGIVQFIMLVYSLFKSKQNKLIDIIAKIKKPLEIVGVISCLGVGAYTGLLIGVVKTAPLWNNAILPTLFLVSALSSGIAASQFFSAIFVSNEAKGLWSLKKDHLVLLIVEMLLLFFMLFIVNSGNAAGVESVQSLVSGKYTILFWGILVIGGLLVPAIIEAIEIRHVNHDPHLNPNLILLFVVEGLVILGGFMLRYLVIEAAVPLNFLGF